MVWINVPGNWCYFAKPYYNHCQIFVPIICWVAWLILLHSSCEPIELIVTNVRRDADWDPVKLYNLSIFV